ncbi:aromatic amino acid ammonia-lyase [Parvibaculum sp.]|uniref:HAL/PAL/TAL family ammonia-lyase n=1 Tax=Parvibaculum sp. TaxID=2024848 RepID=UPI0025DF80F5|nr:aromatic amino acid ammonia-lyase [Parvibaculum sp.]
MTGEVIFGGRDLSLEEVHALATRKATARLSGDPGFRESIARSAAHVAETLARDGIIYGVTTGYGDSVTTPVPLDLVPELPLHLTRFHGVGTGRILTPEETRAVMAARLASLVRGWSGVSIELVELLCEMLRLDILPLIPAEGSVGASGDLTPLSYVAGALAGERRVLFNGRETMSAEAFAEAGMKPVVLRPKEALAVMNGTAVMSGLAAIAYARAVSLSSLSTRLTSLASLALLGNPSHFDERLFAAKPHMGQMKVAARVRDDLSAFAARHAPSRLQDRYSIRCAPHVIGVLEDMAPVFRTTLETEINSANDNPLIDPASGNILHGGHFYGGHVAFVMDSMKNLVANIADLMDRQMALLVDARFNNGLPSNLSGAKGPRAAVNHGLKALQIAASAWTAEALKLTMPASVFSRSTECHNQDKVSMGTIAARDALRVLELSEQVAAALTISVRQALRLRIESGVLSNADIAPAASVFFAEIEQAIPFIEEDRTLDVLIGDLCRRSEMDEWSLAWQEGCS